MLAVRPEAISNNGAAVIGKLVVADMTMRGYKGGMASMSIVATGINIWRG